MPFDSPDYDLPELLKDIGGKKIQLPDFQREWKWEDDRIAGLIASVSLGYPIGVIMLLQLGGEGVRFAPRPIAGVNGVPDREPEHLVLDGQQRLTSLFQALASGKAVDTTDSRGKRLKRWYYIDIRRALDEEDDREEAILSVPEDRVIREDFGRVVRDDYSSPEKECESEVFPLSRAFDHSTLFDWQMAYATSPERQARWKNFYGEVLSNVIGYKLPAIILNKETPKEAVCVVFEKVNTGGVPLNVFELLTATFAAEPGDFRLKDDWKARKSRLDQWQVLRSIESTDFLQAVTLLATRARRIAFDEAGGEGTPPGVSCKRKDILKLGLEEYRTWADPVTDALVWAAKFLAQEHVFRSDDIPYRTQLVPLAAIKVALGDLADGHSGSRKLRQWYWCGVLGELYGGTTETRFVRDLEQVVPWVERSEGVPITVGDASFRAARLLTLRTRNSAAYKGIYALLMGRDCLDWIKNQPMNMATFFDYRVDIHHVFPKAWCNQHGVDKGHVESIVNKTALSYSTNRSIGGRPPSEYVQTLEKQAGVDSAEMDRIIATHLIDAAHLRTDSFEEFFNARADGLLDLIRDAMGKEPIREEMDKAEAEAATFEDEPEEVEDDMAADALYAAPA
jgi:hypothetical protein